jgi:hypothetical protein
MTLPTGWCFCTNSLLFHDASNGMALVYTQLVFQWRFQRDGATVHTARVSMTLPTGWCYCTHSSCFHDASNRMVVLYTQFVFPWRFQRDGGTVHTVHVSMTLLCCVFGNRIISKGIWPLRLPWLQSAGSNGIFSLQKQASLYLNWSKQKHPSDCTVLPICSSSTVGTQGLLSQPVYLKYKQFLFNAFYTFHWT